MNIIGGTLCVIIEAIILVIWARFLGIGILWWIALVVASGILMWVISLPPLTF